LTRDRLLEGKKKREKERKKKEKKKKKKRKKREASPRARVDPINGIARA